MDVEQLKEDVRQGRIAGDRLVDVIVALLQQLNEAKRRIEELERKLGGSPTAKRHVHPIHLGFVICGDEA